MDIRQFSYLAALAREKHFTRAAEACGVTQPTLSGRIRQLEQELGVPIVARGQRYHGLTPEGERVLKWARQILENFEGLREDLEDAKGHAPARITIGAIPSALPTLPPLTEALLKRYPQIQFTVLSQSSEEIRRALEDFSIDVGVTYLDNEPVDLTVSKPLYRERYRLFVREDHALAGRSGVTWAEAAGYPLSALTPNMQNRRIMDAAFRKAKCEFVPELESNSVVNLCAHVQVSGLASILPEYFIGLMGEGAQIRALPLVEPDIEHVVGLVALDRDPLPPLVRDILDVSSAFALPQSLISRLGH
jgi:DNA-binding transcriptional LysR family regulator